MNSSTSSSDERLLHVSGPRTSWKPLLPLVFAILIIAFVEIVLFLRFGSRQSTVHMAPTHRIPTQYESIIQAKLDYIASDLENSELLILGDSSGLMGVNALLLESLTGMETFNMGTLAHVGIEGHRRLLEHYVECRGVPSKVVYHVAPHVAMSYTEAMLLQRPALRRLRQQLDNAEIPLPSLQFRRAAQAQRYGGELSEAQLSAPREYWPSHREMLTSLAASKGAYLETKRTDWTNAPQLSGDCSQFQLNELRRLADMSESYDFKLFFICNPLPRVAKTEENMAALNDMKSTLSDILNEYESITCFTPFYRFVEDDLMATLNHLHPDAVESNTRTIADWILQHSD